MKLLILLSSMVFLSACSSANKFAHIEQGMTTNEVTEELGKPEKQRSNKNKQTEQYIFMLRETPNYFALTGCVLLPIAIPTFAVMWFSDGCLGERADYQVDFVEGKVAKKQKLAKE